MKKIIVFFLHTLVVYNAISQVTINPCYNSNTSELKIEKVSITEMGTIIDMKYFTTTKDKVFWIHPQTYIQKSFDKSAPKYFIKEFVDNKLNHKYVGEPNKTYNLTLIFEKLPPGLVNIDMFEPETAGASAWYWKNININNPNSEVLIWNYYSKKYETPAKWNGNSLNGYADGFGKCDYYENNYSFYEGQIKRGLMHGYGIFRYYLNNNDSRYFIQYEGNWSYGYPVGKGYMTSHLVKEVIVANFSEGKIYGRFAGTDENGQEIVYNCDGGLDFFELLRKSNLGLPVTEKDFPCYEVREDYEDVLKLLIGVGVAAFVIDNGVEDWGKFQKQVLSCAINYGISDIIDNPTNAALLSEAITSTLENRKYSIRNVSQDIAISYVTAELNNSGYTDLANKLSNGAFIYCILSSIW